MVLAGADKCTRARQSSAVPSVSWFTGDSQTFMDPNTPYRTAYPKRPESLRLEESSMLLTSFSSWDVRVLPLMLMAPIGRLEKSMTTAPTQNTWYSFSSRSRAYPRCRVNPMSCRNSCRSVKVFSVRDWMFIRSHFSMISPLE